MERVEGETALGDVAQVDANAGGFNSKRLRMGRSASNVLVLVAVLSNGATGGLEEKYAPNARRNWPVMPKSGRFR